MNTAPDTSILRENNNQNKETITERYFYTLHEDGFMLSSNMTDIYNMIAYVSPVQVAEVNSLAEAYVNCCRRYVEHFFDKYPWTKPTLPMFEDAIKTPFWTPGFMQKPIPSARFFAIAHPTHIAICDNIADAMDFLAVFPFSRLREYSNFMDALIWLNGVFLKRIFPMSAYITDAIPVVKDLPINTAVPVNFVEWYHQHFQPLPELPFPTPYFCVESKEK